MPAATCSLQSCHAANPRARAVIVESPAPTVRRSTLLAVAECADGVWWLTEHVLPGCAAAQRPQRHSKTVECFHVLEGTMTIVIGAHRLIARAGSYTVIPPAVTHAVTNGRNAPLRYIQMSAPAGHEHNFRERIALVRRAATRERSASRSYVTRIDSIRASN